MVHIKKLEIYGFKSFGFKNTTINFERGLIVVTGPNGSGKSNILDAITFAIGENSPKALRVDKFQSLFHDSQNSSHRLIRVSLTFDNTDREIPLDSDSVTVTREMEGQTGDSQYHLNGKKVSKAGIVELLEIVIAAPNKLNIVQQGMITRISELNSDERRKIIEDIVGLSYFDEKKAEAIKQLEESDRRLEIALARMTEVRKRIDELEVERNDQVRYQHLESELKRLKAIGLSNSIREIRNKLKFQNQTLDCNILRLSQLSKQIDEIRSQTERIESEKASFIHRVDMQNKVKAQIESKITNIVYESERMKAMLKESQQRLFHIEKQIPLIDTDKQNTNQKLDDVRSKVEEKKTIMADRSTKVSILESQLKEVNSKIDILTYDNAKYIKIKEKLDYRYKRSLEVKNEIEVSMARLEEKVKINNEKIKYNKFQIFSLRSEMDNNEIAYANLSNSIESEKTKLYTTQVLLEKIGKTITNLEIELANSSNLLDKAKDLAAKYGAKTDLAKNTGNEDIAIADLMKDQQKFGIKGLAYNMIKWDQNYERSVLAAGSEWMKAIVVDKVISMILIAEYAKLNKFPRLKIIPLDIISRTKKRSSLLLKEENVNVIGNLADFVYSDYRNLPDFLYGDTFVVKTPTTAYIMAKRGYRAVSVDGILFEPQESAISLDFGSKISDLTKAILFGESIDKLRSSLTTLEVLIKKRSAELKQNTLQFNDLESKKTKLEANIDSLVLQTSIIVSSITKAKESLKQLISNNAMVQSEIDSMIVRVNKYLKDKSILIPIINKITKKLQSIDDITVTRNDEMSQLNMKKNYILKSLDATNIEFRDIMISSAALNNEMQISLRQLKEMDIEENNLKTELEQRRNIVNELKVRLESIEAELKQLRDEEQQAIDSSGSSYSILQQYEQEARQSRENERKISKEFNTIERETAVLRKDIYDITSQELRLTNDLHSLGYGDLQESFDVEMAIRELINEIETVKTKINLRAHESYVQVIEGYRSMSARQNQLEKERNSIIIFIEEVTKEKRSFFLDAFRKVDSDIRRTFSEVAGDGQAWLELENAEEIFSNGVLLMVQFPGKPARESTGLSGGEKTMAAIIFLLALQSLKPSPFYLMDEVDAHLDAQNNERLSKVLLSRSNNNQIIMVTLKDSTVAYAHIIYGVYSKEGMSQIVKYRHPNQETIAEVKSNANAEK